MAPALDRGGQRAKGSRSSHHRTLKQMTVALHAGSEDLRAVVPGPRGRHLHASSRASPSASWGSTGPASRTLLKLINGIMRPDGGSVLTRGRIAGLIATGAGFHPQLTRAGQHLPQRRDARDERGRDQPASFDDIVEFADIGKHLDSQVGHYSSGQFARLGFAVAIHVDSDIFLADEVLAVGDKPFKKKCMEQDAGDPRRGPDALLRQPRGRVGTQHVRPGDRPREAAALGYDGPVDDGIRYLQYDDPTRPRRSTRSRTRSAPTSEGPADLAST